MILQYNTMKVTVTFHSSTTPIQWQALYLGISLSSAWPRQVLREQLCRRLAGKEGIHSTPHLMERSVCLWWRHPKILQWHFTLKNNLWKSANHEQSNSWANVVTNFPAGTSTFSLLMRLLPLSHWDESGHLSASSSNLAPPWHRSCLSQPVREQPVAGCPCWVSALARSCYGE